MTDDEIAVPRTRSEELTQPMHMIDHTCARIDGPPDVDTIVVEVPYAPQAQVPYKAR